LYRPPDYPLTYRGQGAVTSPLRKQGVAGLSSIDRNFDPRLTAGASNGSPVTDSIPRPAARGDCSAFAARGGGRPFCLDPQRGGARLACGEPPCAA